MTSQREGVPWRCSQASSPIPTPAGDFYRLAWSRAGVDYPLGLAPRRRPRQRRHHHMGFAADFEYKPRVSATDVDITFTLGAFAGGLLSDPSKEFYASHANITANKSPKDKSHFDWKQPALEMSKAVEDMYINQSAEEKIGEASSKPKQSSDLDYWQTVHGKSASEVEGWELVSKEQIKNMHHDTLLSHGSKGFLLEISDLTGPVLGLSFNNQFGNILAAAGKGDTLNLYHIDCHGTDLSRTYKFQDDEMSNAQVTFLEWHPRYSAILASTNDRGTTTVWDIRTKKAAMRAKQQPNEYCSEVHWHPNHPTCFAVASNSNYELAPVKIWDANLFGNMLCEFGPRKGVNSLSWSTTNDLILTTDVDGIIDCWNVKLTTDKSMGQCVAVSVGSCGAVHTTTAGVEARWCDSEDAFVVTSSTGVDLCKLLKSPLG